MEFQPDIVVVSPGELTTHLIVEVTTRGSDAAAKTLKRQMVRMRVPTGLLVTPEWVTVFRDTFKSYSEDSVKDVGQVPASQIPPLQPFARGRNDDPAAFSDAVQNWLVQLKYRLEEGYLSAGDLWPVFQEHILPALSLGEVRAAGPRWPRIAAQ